MLKLKPGVSVRGMRPEILFALLVLHTIVEGELVVTSCTDGKHGRGSKHYIGNAVDIRTRSWTELYTHNVVDALREALGPEYDVVLEKDHLHIEYDPKEALNA